MHPLIMATTPASALTLDKVQQVLGQPVLVRCKQPMWCAVGGEQSGSAKMELSPIIVMARSGRSAAAARRTVPRLNRRVEVWAQ